VPGPGLGPVRRHPEWAPWGPVHPHHGRLWLCAVESPVVVAHRRGRYSQQQHARQQTAVRNGGRGALPSQYALTLGVPAG
jgi:hypothetical protein